MTEKRKNTKKVPNCKEDIPNLRFPEFADCWKVKNIRDLGGFIGGGTPDTTIQKFWEGKIPWISSSDITIDDIHNIQKTRFITEGAIKSSATKLIPKGGILMVSRVGIGKFAVADEELCTSQDFTNLVTTENEYFLCYYFSARSSDFVRLSQGTSIKGFTTQDIKSAKFSIPSIKEQDKISSFLSLLDERIATQSKIIEELKLLKAAVSKKIFSRQLRFQDDKGKEFPNWEIKKLGEICEKKSSNISANKIEDNFGEYLIYGASGILKNVDFYEEENDYISIVKDGAGVGRLFYCKGKSSVLGTMDIVKPKNTMNTYFLFCLLSTIDFTKYVTGSTIPHIYFKDYKNEYYDIPCIEEQTKIADFLSALDNKIVIERMLLHQLENQKQYLLQNLFI